MFLTSRMWRFSTIAWESANWNALRREFAEAAKNSSNATAYAPGTGHHRDTGVLVVSCRAATRQTRAIRAAVMTAVNLSVAPRVRQGGGPGPLPLRERVSPGTLSGAGHRHERDE